ncbi:MAG TPA: hypothetical protein VG273_28065 [Bryobacteraceae bacterium]|nr:hypothetical protein [Bryobacteraceae bacterium]
MQTTVNLPDSLYEKSVALAAARGATVEQVIVEALSRTLSDSDSLLPTAEGRTGLPVIRSRRPGTLDLAPFDFDELLA